MRPSSARPGHAGANVRHQLWPARHGSRRLRHYWATNASHHQRQRQACGPAERVNFRTRRQKVARCDRCTTCLECRAASRLAQSGMAGLHGAIAAGDGAMRAGTFRHSSSLGRRLIAEVGPAPRSPETAGRLAALRLGRTYPENVKCDKNQTVVLLLSIPISRPGAAASRNRRTAPGRAISKVADMSTLAVAGLACGPDRAARTAAADTGDRTGDARPARKAPRGPTAGTALRGTITRTGRRPAASRNAPSLHSAADRAGALTLCVTGSSGGKAEVVS